MLHDFSSRYVAKYVRTILSLHILVKPDAKNNSCLCDNFLEPLSFRNNSVFGQVFAGFKFRRGKSLELSLPPCD